MTKNIWHVDLAKLEIFDRNKKYLYDRFDSSGVTTIKYWVKNGKNVSKNLLSWPTKRFH